MPETNQSQTNSFAFGLLLTFGCTIAAVMLGLSLSGANRVAILTRFPFNAFGVVQLVYIVPIVIGLFRRGHFKAAIAVMTFAAMILLWNAVFWVFMSFKQT